MTKVIIEDFKNGKEKSGVPFWAFIWAWIISLPFRLLMLFIPKKHNYVEVTNDNWTDWTTINDLTIQRKIVAETGFDGVIKFYHLKSSNKDLNELFDERFFGTFYKETRYGVFLREFNDPEDWPKSYLSLITKDFKSIQRLRKIDSSWTNWRLESVDNESFNIVTHPAKEYTKGIKITAPNKGQKS